MSKLPPDFGQDPFSQGLKQAMRREQELEAALVKLRADLAELREVNAQYVLTNAALQEELAAVKRQDRCPACWATEVLCEHHESYYGDAVRTIKRRNPNSRHSRRRWSNRDEYWITTRPAVPRTSQGPQRAHSLVAASLPLH